MLDSITVYLDSDSGATVNAQLVLVWFFIVNKTKLLMSKPKDAGGVPSSGSSLVAFSSQTVSGSSSYSAYTFYPLSTFILEGKTNYWFLLSPQGLSSFRWATTTASSSGPGVIPLISATFNGGAWAVDPNVVTANQIKIMTGTACVSGTSRVSWFVLDIIEHLVLQ